MSELIEKPCNIEFSAGTHCGTVRDINEDAILTLPEEGLWVVADGMGGHAAGDVASNLIVDGLKQLDGKLPFISVVDQVEDVLLRSHREIRHYAREHCEGRTMGSTLTALVVRGSVGVCLWAGDSRLYRWRNGELKAMTSDHSQVREMVMRGVLSEEEAEGHPASNIITRAVGAGEMLFVDTCAVEFKPGDKYLLCTDGLYGAVSHEDMSSFFESHSVAERADALIEAALACNARDNVSVITLDITAIEECSSDEE